jgi:hypothetical protein
VNPKLNPIAWPDGKQFAFTIHDDTDAETVENVGAVYSFLADCGFRATKSCWCFRGEATRGKFPGQTLDDQEYRQWLMDLHRQDFGIDWHGTTWHGSRREEVMAAFERFAEVFGHYPQLATNHSCNEEAMYWGSDRLTGWRRVLYNFLTRFRNSGRFRGHIENDEHFWGDLCKERVQYFRNFVYRDVNTLKACPYMPYHDATKPYVNYWFASSDGSRVNKFNDCLSEESQDRLEAEGGACIMYTHFALGFKEGKRLNPRFKQLMERLAKKNGWFVRVGLVLDHLLAVKGHYELTPAERRWLETKWLWEKIFIGSN